LGGQIDAQMTTPTTVISQVEAGNVRMLAVSSAERYPLFPDVPSMKEKGFDIDINPLYVIFGPKGIPNETKEVLNEAFQQMVDDPEYQKKMEELAISVSIMSGQEVVDQFNRMIPIYEGLINNTDK
jgi:tripartite-type tricarboxylate transporter receptor subunit TctC